MGGRIRFTSVVYVWRSTGYADGEVDRKCLGVSTAPAGMIGRAGTTDLEQIGLQAARDSLENGIREGASMAPACSADEKRGDRRDHR